MVRSEAFFDRMMAFSALRSPTMAWLPWSGQGSAAA